MICMIFGLVSAVKLYQQPSQARVQNFFGWLLLGFCYEYAKHLGDYLVQPVFFLFILEWAWLQQPMALLVQIVIPTLVLISGVLFLTMSLYIPQQQSKHSSQHVKDSA
jgi:hypothetical protein